MSVSTHENGVIVLANPKHQRFVEEYLLDLNPRQAAIRAGYEETSAGKTAKGLLARPAVSRAIAELLAAKRAQTLSTSASVVADLEEIVRRCMDPEDKLFKPSEAIRALELLGKHHGTWERDNQQKATVIRITANV